MATAPSVPITREADSRKVGRTRGEVSIAVAVGHARGLT